MKDALFKVYHNAFDSLVPWYVSAHYYFKIYSDRIKEKDNQIEIYLNQIKEKDQEIMKLKGEINN